MHTLPEITFVPYQQAGEPERRAAFIPVEIDLSNLSDEDLQVVGHLIEAVQAINPVFRDQFDPRTEIIQALLHELAEFATDEEKQQFQNYLQILNLQNSPFSLLPRKNHLLQVPESRLRELAEHAGPEAVRTLEGLVPLFYKEVATPDFANFYPVDFREEEFKALGDKASVVNSRVLRDPDGKPRVHLNEVLYRETLQTVIEHLQAARSHCSDPGFVRCLDTRILELQTGSEEARREADAAWIRHDFPIDIVISTGLEVYLDAYKNIRGAATGGVYLRNEAAQTLLEEIVERVERFEREAPWTWKKTEINPANLPKLKFVDVLAWSGDYVTSPNTTLAQSLPNDSWVIENIGTVNMVFNNTTRAITRVTGELMAREFLPGTLAQTIAPLMFEGNQLHSALHEIGHTTGKMDPEHSAGQPSDYLEEEYSWLEETRAELFGLWALPMLVSDGIINQETADASYTGFLLTLLGALRFEPVQAHTMARNLIFHAFEENSVILTSMENGALRFSINPDTVHAAVSELLKTIADIKAGGDKRAAAALREKWMFADPRRAEFDQRSAQLPLGRGLSFPVLEKDGDRYTSHTSYPPDFSSQPVFSLSLK